jgi:hypothetical protein
MKHIEQILPEYAANELYRLLGNDDATATTSLTPVLHAVTGCAIPPLATTPQSEVEELVPLCLSILRRHWTTPLTALGDGTTPMSLADLLRRLIGDRVQGNEALGIPPANANIPTAVSALCDRHMSDGLTLTLTDGTTTSLPDGLSLAQLLCSVLADNITELRDDNKGWVMTKALSIFPNAEKILLGCSGIVRKYDTNTALYSFSKCKSLRAPLLKTISSTTDSSLPSYTPIFNGSPLEEVDLSELQSYTGRLFVGGSLPEELNLPKLTNAGTCIAQGCAGVKRIIAENVTTCTGYSYHPNLIMGCPDLEYAYIPNLSAYTVYGDNDGASSLQDMPKLSHLVIGKAPFTNNSTIVRFALDGCPNLVLLDIRGGLNQNIYLDHWSPTTALAERLDEFLSNFQTYIADRVADRTGEYALTLTLSAAVYAALQAQEGQTILATLTSKNWTVAQA